MLVCISPLPMRRNTFPVRRARNTRAWDARRGMNSKMSSPGTRRIFLRWMDWARSGLREHFDQQARGQVLDAAAGFAVGARRRDGLLEPDVPTQSRYRYTERRTRRIAQDGRRSGRSGERDQDAEVAEPVMRMRKSSGITRDLFSGLR